MIATVPDLLYMDMSAEKNPSAVLSGEETVAKCCIDILSDILDKEIVVSIIVLTYHHLEHSDFMFHFVKLHHIRKCIL
jgi:hypothetical protein